MDDAIAGPERDAASVPDEVGQRVVRHDVYRFRVGRRVAKRLHDEVCREAEAGEVLQLVTGHWPCGVLAADGGHLRFDVHAGEHARQTAGLGHHLLRERVPRRLGRLARHRPESLRRWQLQAVASPAGEPATEDQVHAAARLHLVQQNVRLQLKGREDLLGVVRLDDALIGEQIDDIAHVQVVHVHLDRQSARVLHRVEENGRDGSPDAYRPEALVRHVLVVVAHKPKHRVRGGLARRARADHVADVGEREALLLELGDLRLTVVDAVARVLQHGHRMERDVGSRPRVLRRRQVVRVRFAGHLEDAQRHLLRDPGLCGEPLCLGPTLHHLLGEPVAGLGLLLHVELRVEHKDRVLERFGGLAAEGLVVEGLDQGCDVVAADHRAQQLHGVLLGDQG
mmetsp:Transcript_4747/g.11949  ORF Transcript_4747/g.11949 Transcript_4747/m.11949 type:complete len:396 (-) Transcript_4747:175-1362(-)